MKIISPVGDEGFEQSECIGEKIFKNFEKLSNDPLWPEVLGPHWRSGDPDI